MKSKTLKAIGATITMRASNLAYNVNQRLSQVSEFTTVPRADPADIPPVCLCLFSISEYSIVNEPINITHIGILRKGQRVATSQVRLTASSLVDFTEGMPYNGGISLTDLQTVLPKKYWQYLERAFTDDYNNIGEKTGIELLKAILILRADKEGEINRLTTKLANRKKKFIGARFQNVAAEKDALGLCLDIFDYDRKEVLQSWEPPSSEQPQNSFLSGLKEFAAYEDDLINYDLNNFPGFEAMQRNMSGVVQFQNRHGDNLLVINANRKPLEKALGVDLIYFHRKYNAFTFVQYKMMSNRVENSQSVDYYYNPKEKSHREELERMRKFAATLNLAERSNLLNDYRLLDCPIFFKVCKKIQFSSDDTAIVPGAYIPLPQWELLIEDETTRGPKGGCQIGFHTLKRRYIGTKVFVELIQRGFLGTQTYNSSKIATFVEEAIKKGHTVMYAVDDSKAFLKDEDDPPRNIASDLRFE